MILDDKNIAEFLRSEDKLKDFNPLLKALWYDGNGDWRKAHDEVDGLDGKDAARIHAYLHRKEGDEWNTGYWYRRSGEEMCNLTLREEWVELLRRHLK